MQQCWDNFILMFYVFNVLKKMGIKHRKFPKLHPRHRLFVANEGKDMDFFQLKFLIFFVQMKTID